MDVVLGLLWLLAAVLGGGDRDPECLLLGVLDATRTRAFVSADPAQLRDVYLDAEAARHDVEVLRSYRARGLRLEGMRLVRESCRVVHRSSRRLAFDVVDRLGPTSVRTAEGRHRDLPIDGPTRHTVVLWRTAQGWRVVAIRN